MEPGNAFRSNRPAGSVVSEVINGKTGITRTSAIQFGAALGTTAQYWLDLQDEYELWLLSRDKDVQTMLRAIKRRAKAYVKFPQM